MKRDNSYNYIDEATRKIQIIYNNFMAVSEGELLEQDYKDLIPDFELLITQIKFLLKIELNKYDDLVVQKLYYRVNNLSKLIHDDYNSIKEYGKYIELIQTCDYLIENWNENIDDSYNQTLYFLDQCSNYNQYNKTYKNLYEEIKYVHDDMEKNIKRLYACNKNIPDSKSTALEINRIYNADDAFKYYLKIIDAFDKYICNYGLYNKESIEQKSLIK